LSVTVDERHLYGSIGPSPSGSIWNGNCRSSDAERGCSTNVPMPVGVTVSGRVLAIGVVAGALAPGWHVSGDTTAESTRGAGGAVVQEEGGLKRIRLGAASASIQGLGPMGLRPTSLLWPALRAFGTPLPRSSLESLEW
jgi:hypothetical protein